MYSTILYIASRSSNIKWCRVQIHLNWSYVHLWFSNTSCVPFGDCRALDEIHSSWRLFGQHRINSYPPDSESLGKWSTSISLYSSELHSISLKVTFCSPKPASKSISRSHIDPGTLAWSRLARQKNACVQVEHSLRFFFPELAEQCLRLPVNLE